MSVPRDPSYLGGDEGLLVIDVDQHIFPRTGSKLTSSGGTAVSRPERGSPADSPLRAMRLSLGSRLAASPPCLPLPPPSPSLSSIILRTPSPQFPLSSSL